MIPAFYKAYSRCEDDREMLVDVMKWVEKRARVVLKALIVETPLPMAEEDTITPDLMDWQQVCARVVSRSEFSH